MFDETRRRIHTQMITSLRKVGEDSPVIEHVVTAIYGAEEQRV